MSPEAAEFTAKYGVDLICKDKSWSMRVINILLWPLLQGRFMTDFITTIRFPFQRGFIAYPVGVSEADFLSPTYAQVRTHELFHVDQQKGPWGLIKSYVLYLIFPLPALLSGRWWLERYAYLSDIKAGKLTVDQAVDALWWGYFFCWPRSWMKDWFLKQLSF